MRKPFHQRVWRKIGQAIGDYNLIEQEDRIAVGISGGKDSITLLYALRHLQRISKVDFSLQAIHLGMGWEQDFTPLKTFCEEIQVPFHHELTQIAPIVFEARQEKNPCSLCAKLRRGALNNTAITLDCNKVALGHHLDDAIETLLLCMFYEGRYSCFMPKTYLDRKNITVIRPMIYVKEDAIKQVVKDLEFPILPYLCPAAATTKRQEMKDLIQQLERQIPGVRDRLLSSLQHVNVDHLWIKK